MGRKSLGERGRKILIVVKSGMVTNVFSTSTLDEVEIYDKDVLLAKEGLSSRDIEEQLFDKIENMTEVY